MEAGTFSLVPVEVIRDKRLTLEQTRVLIALFSFRNKVTDTVWPSRAAIAERTGMHVSNISTATTGLVELGWLLKEGQGGHSKATRYTLCVPSIFGAGTVAQQATVADRATVACSATRPVAEAATPPVAESATRKEQTTEQTKEQTNKVALAQPDGVPDQVWADFLSLRKAKKAPLTSTALEGIAREAAKAGRTLGDVLALCCTRGWQGFRADWLTDTKSASPTRPAKFDPVAFVNGRKEDAHVVIDVPAQRVA